MTQATPPGWYPDPGQTSDGPATERWWDGEAWTDRTRPAAPPAGEAPRAPADADDDSRPSPGPADAKAGAEAGAGTDLGSRPAPQPAHSPHPPYVAHPTYPAHPGYPGRPPESRRRGLRTGIAVAVAVAVLASIGAGVYVLTDGDGTGGERAGGQRATPGAPREQDGPSGDSGGDSGGGSPAPDGSQEGRIDSGSVTDPVNGISLPIPDGWHGQELMVGASIASDDTYKCPGDTSRDCMKGGAYSAPAQVLGTRGRTAEEVAKADIEANAEESYGQGYGSLASHEVLASEKVTVAGQQGYRVRWKAITSKGSDGYVESLALPSPADPRRIVVVRLGVDVGEKQAVLDEIAEGIEAAEGRGGTGQDV
ncbi:DUF2510 domain-containing protein [Streptomyces poriticola]|uniref:DUF2510 domain-containing protein n=1 Tax=Streptomyces poriticola TaxID=3120506 RepID=UPI002FCE48A1